MRIGKYQRLLFNKHLSQMLPLLRKLFTNLEVQCMVAQVSVSY